LATCAKDYNKPISWAAWFYEDRSFIDRDFVEKFHRTCENAVVTPDAAFCVLQTDFSVWGHLLHLSLYYAYLAQHLNLLRVLSACVSSHGSDADYY